MSDDVVVLLDYEARPGDEPFENLVRIDPAGAIVWTAPLPSPSTADAYVSFDLDADEVVANSWSGYLVRIDLASGQLLHKTFVK